MTLKPVLNLAAVFLVSCCPLWAVDDGSALYKTKCASCHGANGDGKPAIKAPALKGTKWEVNQIADHITKGASGSKAPHNKGISGLDEERAKTIAEYVKTLK